eukprot:COSAG01_NODE_13_length_41723_cov_145.394556_46_plen_72_part_00
MRCHGPQQVLQKRPRAPCDAEHAEHAPARPPLSRQSADPSVNLIQRAGSLAQRGAATLLQVRGLGHNHNKN